MKAFAHHLLFELRSGFRNRTLLLMFYLFPLTFYLMIGFIMPSINPFFGDALIPAMVVFSVLVATLIGLPDPLINARTAGIFRSFKIWGVPACSILVVPALSTVLHLIIMTVLIIISAPILFGAPLPGNWPSFILVFVALTLASSGLGVLISVISDSTRTQVLLSQLIFLPSMLLGGLMFPYRMLPDAASTFSQLLPATHAMNAFLGLSMGKEADFSPLGSISVLLFGGLLAFLLSVYLFSWDSQNLTRKGNRLLAALVLAPYLAGMLLLA